MFTLPNLIATFLIRAIADEGIVYFQKKSTAIDNTEDAFNCILGGPPPHNLPPLK
jgi:hypothetical protein